MTDLEDFDSMLEQEPTYEEKQRMTRLANDAKIVNTDVAARLASGERVKDLAVELGVAEQAIRYRMRRADFKDLLAIEARRALLHASKRKLSKVPYRDIIDAAVNLIDKEDKLRNANVGAETRLINSAFVEQINILIQRPGSESKSLPNSGSSTTITAEEIPDIPEQIGQGEPGEIDSPDVGGSKE